MGIGLCNTVFGWVLDDEEGANDRRVKLARLHQRHRG